MLSSSPLVDRPGRLVAEQARRLVGDRHLGEHELHRLVLRDRHAEGLALERVGAATRRARGG